MSNRWHQTKARHGTKFDAISDPLRPCCVPAELQQEAWGTIDCTVWQEGRKPHADYALRGDFRKGNKSPVAKNPSILRRNP